MADESSNLHDLLNQIQAVEIAGDHPDQDQEIGECEHEVEAPEFSNNHEQYLGYDYTGRSSATDQDYLILGGYINQSLKTYSIPFPYPGPIDFHFKSTPSRVRVVNTILDLLNQRQQSKEFIVEAQEVIRKLGVSKRDVKQRTQTVLKECNIQEAKIKELSSELLRKEADLRRTEADLNEKLEDILREKKSLEFRGKQNVTENKKKNKIIQELKSRAKSLMNFQEKRVTLGLRAINDDLIFRTSKPSNDHGSKRDENELLKEELQYKKEQIEYLTNENQSIRHDLMTLRHEVTGALNLLGGINDDELFENMSMGNLDVEPHVGGMPWKESILRKSEEEHKFIEGRQTQRNSNAPAGEEYDGPSLSQHVNMPTVPQPGSTPIIANILKGSSQLDNIDNMGNFDLNFEKFIANESNPMGNYGVGSLSSINMADFTVDISGLDTGDFEYANINFDQN